MGIFGTVLTIALGGLFVHGFPGKLNEQRYEFQPLTGAEDVSRRTGQTVQQVVAVEPSLKWSQQHPNEVNAFAEVYRQSYNQLVEQYNRMFGLQYGYVMPVHYQLFNLPEGYSWQDYFGSQQQYVKQQTEEMSRRLFAEIQHGRFTQQDLQAPSFFVNQVADLLDHVHSHVQEEVPPQEQKHENLHGMAEVNNNDHGMVLAFNPATGNYEYVFVQKTEEITPKVRTSYIQSLPPVQFNNREFDRDIESSESFVERTTTSTARTTTDNYYASTYDQQQLYDQQFLESISSTPSIKPNNVMSLVRKKQSTSSSTSTTTTTTPKPTTESSVMSMLPHKQLKINYTDIQHQIRQAMDQLMKQHNETENGETHFMGMTSNQDHVKLTYDVDNSQRSTPGKPATHVDLQNSYEDFVTEEPVEQETIQPTLATVTEKVTKIPPSVRPKPTQRIPTETVPLYNAPLAPFPIVVHDNNPFYTAPLAPFPGEVLIQPPHVQPVQFSELDDMNQEHFLPEQHAHFPGHDDIYQDVQGFEQIPMTFSPPAEDQQLAMTHVLGLQQNAQSSTGFEQQHQQFERQQPPEQAYRSLEYGHPQLVVPIKTVEEPAQIFTVASPIPEPHQKIF